MILEYDYFVKKLNEKLVEGSCADLLEKIVDSPDRYVGIFRPTKAKTKLIQNITQSHEIKFGDALEDIFEEYFTKLGFIILPKVLIADETSDGNEYNIDQLFKKGDTIYLIEQKVRDDHDSTKKVGQFGNFRNKYFEVKRKYNNNTIVPIMWFIDASLKKNKKYYKKQMEKMAVDFNCDPRLYYGDELFEDNENGIAGISNEMWEEVSNYLAQWKTTLPDMLEVDFDANAQKAFEEIKDLKPSIYKKMFNKQAIVKEIFPIIFTTGEVLRLLAGYFHSKNEVKNYKVLEEMINNYLEKRFENK